MGRDEWMEEFDEQEKNSGEEKHSQFKFNHPSKTIRKNQLFVLGGLGAGILLLIILGAFLKLGSSAEDLDVEKMPAKIELLEEKVSKLEMQIEDLKQERKQAEEVKDLEPLTKRINNVAEDLEDFKQQTVNAYSSLEEKLLSKIQEQGTTSSAAVNNQSREQNVQYHVVKKGENLYRIGLKYDVSTSNLRRWNDLNPDDPIYPGQKLQVTSGSSN